jgi:hypothetical protein
MAPGPKLPYDSPNGKDIQRIARQMLKECHFDLEFTEGDSQLKVKLVHHPNWVEDWDKSKDEVLVEGSVYIDHGHLQYSESI